MSTTYNPTYPNPNDPPRNDVQTMQNNAQAIYNIWDKDHYTFDAATAGLHKHSTYIVQSAPPTAAGQVAQYGNTSSGSSELFLVRDNNATPVQLTRGYVSATGNTLGSLPNSGYSFLPGGILIQWGAVQGNTAGTGSAVITFPVTFTTIFSITGNIQAGGAQAYTIKSVSTSGAVAQTSSGNQTVNWMAIGV